MKKPTKKKPERNALGILREEVFLRDGLDCVPCKLLGSCDPKGTGWCRGIQLPSPTLPPVTFFKLDRLRANSDHRYHLSHLATKRSDRWRDLVMSCPCHNYQISQTIREACYAYTAQFPEEGTPRFEEALARRPAEKTAKKQKAKQTRKAAYEKTTKKYGKPTIPSAPMRSAPSAPKPKKARGASKWADFPIQPATLHR